MNHFLCFITLVYFDLNVCLRCTLNVAAAVFRSKVMIRRSLDFSSARGISGIINGPDFLGYQYLFCPFSVWQSLLR